MPFNKYLIACQNCDIPTAIKYCHDRNIYHHAAAEYGLIELFKWFMAKGHHVDFINLSYVAVEKNQIGLLKWFSTNNLGASAWRLSCEAALLGKLDIFKWFIEKQGVQITTTPIIWAINAGHLHIVKWIYSVIYKYRYFNHSEMKAYILHALNVHKQFPQWFLIRQPVINWLEEYYFTDRFVLLK